MQTRVKTGAGQEPSLACRSSLDSASAVVYWDVFVRRRREGARLGGLVHSAPAAPAAGSTHMRAAAPIHSVAVSASLARGSPLTMGVQ